METTQGMDEKWASAEARFEDLKDRCRVDARVDAGGGGSKAFGAEALKTNGKIFAMLVKGVLVVKLPRARVQAMVERGEGVPFEPSPGQVMKEWVTLTEAADDRWEELAAEALEFVGQA